MEAGARQSQEERTVGGGLEPCDGDASEEELDDDRLLLAVDREAEGGVGDGIGHVEHRSGVRGDRQEQAE